MSFKSYEDFRQSLISAEGQTEINVWYDVDMKVGEKVFDIQVYGGTQRDSYAKWVSKEGDASIYIEYVCPPLEFKLKSFEVSES